MNIIFLGTPSFAFNVLSQLYLNPAHTIVGVVLQPDKVNGRGNKISISPVKEFAIENNINCFQFDNISNQGVDVLKQLNADIMVTCAYGQILSDEIIKITKYGVINVHASLLPKYRGSSPVNWAILNGDDVTGITIMQTVRELDSGDIILQNEIKINQGENFEQLLNRLSFVGAKCLNEALTLIETGSASFTKQIASEATFCKMLKKSDGLIDFDLDCKQIENKVLGLYPWPSAYTFFNKQLIKIHSAKALSQEEVQALNIENYCGVTVGSLSVGTIVNLDNGIVVKCKTGFINFLQVQKEGGKKLESKEFLRGFTLKVLERFC